MKKKNVFLRFAIICSTILIVWTVMSAKLVYLSFQDAEDIYKLGFDIVEHGEGGHIKSDIYYSLGTCAYETTTTTKHGSTVSSSTDYYYVIPAYDKNDDVYFICVLVDSKDDSAYKSITYDENAKAVSFEGTINELDDEIYDYMLESMKEWNDDTEFYASDAELKNHVLPLYLQPMNFDAATAYIITFLVILVVTILMWALYFIKRSKLKVEAATFQAQIQAQPQYPVDASFDTQTIAMDSSQLITLYGTSYPKSSFEHINTYVCNHETVIAIKELRDMTGLGLAEAKNVIDNWSHFYN